MKPKRPTPGQPKKPTLEQLADPGRHFAVPKKGGRGRWWVQIVERHPSGKWVKVGHPPGGFHAHGQPWWVEVDQLSVK